MKIDKACAVHEILHLIWNDMGDLEGFASKRGRYCALVTIKVPDILLRSVHGLFCSPTVSECAAQVVVLPLLQALGAQRHSRNIFPPRNQRQTSEQGSGGGMFHIPNPIGGDDVNLPFTQVLGGSRLTKRLPPDKDTNC